MAENPKKPEPEAKKLALPAGTEKAAPAVEKWLKSLRSINKDDDGERTIASSSVSANGRQLTVVSYPDYQKRDFAL